MSNLRNVSGSAKTKRSRAIKLAPMTRAVRTALAVSAMALAFGASAGAVAADHRIPQAQVLMVERAAIDFAPVFDLTAVGPGIVVVVPPGLHPTLIDESAPGDITIYNANPISEFDIYYSVTAISGDSDYGDVSITNTADGELYAGSIFGDAIGIYGYSATGDVSIDNSGAISAYSYSGLADGIFAYGEDVDVSNSGAIEVYGYTWAAGIEAESSVSTTVTNSGDITASAGEAYFRYDAYAQYIGAAQGGQATGIYATGGAGGVDISNSGNIEVSGGYVAGMDVTATGDITIDNSGSIESGPDPVKVIDYSVEIYGIVTVYGAQLADGISATSLGEGSHVSITNSGDIHVSALYGSSGIAATASGYGSTAEVWNSGSIYAGQYFKYGYGAYGIVASADSDATVGNAGAISVVSTGAASGAAALSFAGDAVVTNSGDVDVTSRSAGRYASTGLLAFAGHGEARVENDGSVVAVSYGYIGRAIDAQGYSGASVVNNGSLYADAKYAYGIYAVSTGGDAVVSNGETGEIGFYASGDGFGIFAVGVNGDAIVDNAGSIEGQAWGQATGVFGLSVTGDVHLSNTGTIEVATENGAALGLFARAWDGTAYVANSGDIDVSTFDYSEYTNAFGYLTYGILAQGGRVEVANSGNITVEGEGYATGIVASALGDVEVVTTGGSIEVYSPGTWVTYAVYVPPGGGGGGDGGGGDVVRSAGDLQTTPGSSAATPMDGGYGGGYGYYNYYYVLVGAATGIDAQSAYGDVTVTNASNITVGSVYVNATGINAVALYDVAVTNSGDITATTIYGYALGISAFAAIGNASVDNTGSIDVVSATNVAVGLFARADYGTASVANSGDITATAGTDYYLGYAAYGMLARGEYAEAFNSGDIVATADAYATGIAAASYYGTTVVTTGGDIDVSADGALVLRSYQGYYGGTYYYYALVGAVVGIDASAGYGDVMVSNASDITAQSLYVSATGINATALYDVAVTNSGDISASSLYSYATGINASASAIYLGKYYGSLVFNGTTSVSNSGDITLYAPQRSAGRATGIFASRDQGDVVVGNSGDIDIYAGGRSYGIFAFATYGDVSVTNSGDISMLSHYDAQIGIQASTGNFFFGGGDVSVVNSGNISVHSDYGFANAIGAVAGSVQNPYGNSYIRNSGDLDVFGQYNAAGIQTRASEGNATIINSGDVNVESAAVNFIYQPDQTVGIAALTFFGGDLTIQNTGDVNVNGYALAYGIYAQSFNDGTVRITNAGDVSVHSQLSTDGAVGNYGYALPAMIAQGVFAVDYFGDIIVNNTSTGSIDASGGDIAIGVHTASYTGAVVVNNAGHIHAGDTNFAIGVLMEGIEGTNTLNNAATGVISADGEEGYAFAVMGSYAVDTINNSGDILGAVALYAGDDVFNNRSGGLWDVGGTRSSNFGTGNDTINNFAGGLIQFDDGAITLGGGTANAFTNHGMISVSGDTNVIDMGGDGATMNTVAFTNVNTISFLDGHTDDALSIVGHLGGTGSLGLDVDFADESSDQLYVDGNMTASAAQRVNIAFAGMPLTASTSIDFAHVSGTSAAGSFVPGQILGYNPARNFLDIAFTIGSRLNAANTADDVFSINLDVVGLLDSGTLAANVASGAAGMLNAQVGTFKQRMGVNPYGDSGKVMSAFFRTYTSEGDVEPGHMAANFGQGGNFGYDQSTWGREVGVNANLHGNVHAGVTLGTADGRQRLTGNGVGSNRMDGMTWGVYATWFAPQGFYVDVSGRWMAVDVVSTSAAGQMQSRAHTGAWNLEAGYNWTLGGLSVVPQVQYTRTEVEDVRAILGDRANFEGHGGTSTRGRVGVEISQTFQAGDLRWTPYGSIHAIREFDGEMGYTVADNFFGSTDTKGTSAMAELGVGVQKDGWGFTIGANWTDGGAFKSTVGGQALVRFAW